MASATCGRRSRSGMKSVIGWASSRQRGNLGGACLRLGLAEEALEAAGRALDLNRELGNRFGEGSALVNLADVLLSLNRAEEAIDSLQRAHRIFENFEYADGSGYALYHLPGGLLLKLGRISFSFSRHLFPLLSRRILFGSPVREQWGTSLFRAG
jgi:tetratricopeptide (TPR) repeat protein